MPAPPVPEVSADVSADVAVVGAGPAGWAVAAACVARGLDTVLVAPRPRAVWRSTYGVWTDQCAALPPGARVVTASTVLAGAGRLDRGYAVLDNESVLAGFGRTGVRTVAGTVVSVVPGPPWTVLRLRSGARVRCAVAVDASGQRRVASGGPPPGHRAEQTAYGLVLPERDAAPVVAPGEAVFMRWGTEPGWPTFLYAVPLPGGRTLVEETSLARRPGLPVGELAARLTRRLTAAGVAVERAVGAERVRFAVDLPVARHRPGVVAFGVAGGLMHPATGYSVGDVLATAPVVAAALADGLLVGDPASAAHRALWPPAARAVRALRTWGLRTLLSLPPARVPEFFDAFFTLPGDLQRAFLTGRADPVGTAAAMTGVFRAASLPLKGVLATGWARR